MLNINIQINSNNENKIVYSPIHINSSKKQNHRNFLTRAIFLLISLAFFSLLAL